MIKSAIMMRGEFRRSTYLYVDECQQFLSPSFKVIMEQSRKFGLHMIMANQSIGSLGKIEDTILTNTAIKLLGRTDSPTTMKKAQSITGAHLATFQYLKNYEFYVKASQRKGRVYRIPDILLVDRRLSSTKEEEYALNRRQVHKYYTSIETDPPKLRKRSPTKHQL